jgi:hypothetical protein
MEVKIYEKKIFFLCYRTKDLKNRVFLPFYTHFHTFFLKFKVNLKDFQNSGGKGE